MLITSLLNQKSKCNSNNSIKNFLRMVSQSMAKSINFLQNMVKQSEFPAYGLAESEINQNQHRNLIHETSWQTREIHSKNDEACQTRETSYLHLFDQLAQTSNRSTSKFNIKHVPRQLCTVPYLLAYYSTNSAMWRHSLARECENTFCILILQAPVFGRNSESYF